MRKYMGVLLMVVLMLTACSSTQTFSLKKEIFTLEFGKQISTKAETYVAKDTDKYVSKEAKVFFKESKSYTVDNKSNTLKAKDKDYLPVGKYNGSIKYRDNKEDFIVEIKDTTAPKFVDFKDEISIEVGSTVKLEDNFKVEDLSKVTISVNKEKIDLNKEGSYKIQVTATDQYKNKVTKKATIKVVPKKVVEEPAEENANDNTTNNAGGTAPRNNTQTPSNGPSSNAGNNNTQAPSQPQQPDESSCQVGVPHDDEEAKIIATNGIWNSFNECIKYIDDNGLTGTVISVIDKCYNIMGYTIILH